MQIIVRDNHYPLDYVKAKVNVGLTDQFKVRWPMERRVARSSTEAELARFRNRPQRVPWPWEVEASAARADEQSKLSSIGD